MSDETKPPGLYAKLAQVIGEVGYVAKDGKNDFQNYRYTSAEAFLNAVRGPLSSRGVVVMPSLTALSEKEYTTSKGKASVITTAHIKFTFVDSETGQMHECEWAGQGDDPADKGLGKALTNAIKTFLREQFLIPTGDDPEADSRTDSRAADRAPRQNGTAQMSQAHAARAPLHDAVVANVGAARDRAGMPPDWFRMQLVAVGATDVPEGPATKGTIRALTPEQAAQLIAICDQCATDREKAAAK